MMAYRTIGIMARIKVTRAGSLRRTLKKLRLAIASNWPVILTVRKILFITLVASESSSYTHMFQKALANYLN